MSDDYRQILNVVHSYAEMIDGGDFAAVGELLGDATLVCEAPGERAPVEVRGAEHIRAMYEATTRRYEDGTPRTRHLLSNPIVEIDESRGVATCRYYCTVFQRTDDFPLQPVWANRYEDQLQRVDGRWRIVHRRGFAHLPGDVSQHLL